MSLVAYGSSDESDEDDNQNQTNVAKKQSETASNSSVNKVDIKRNGLKSDFSNSSDQNLGNDTIDVNSFSSKKDDLLNSRVNISDDEDEIDIKKHKNSSLRLNECKNDEIKSLLSLPAPKTKLHDIDFDWSCLTKGTKKNVQPIKIAIPSLADLETEEPSEPVKKKLKPSKKGSGLFALLPSPKNAFINQTRTTLKPKQTLNKGLTNPIFKKEIPSSNLKINKKLTNKIPSVSYDDSADEDEGHESDDKKIDFFSLSTSTNEAADINAAVIQITDDMDPIESLNKKEENLQIQQPKSSQWINNSIKNKLAKEKDNVTPVTSEYVSFPATSSESFIPLDQTDIQLDETALQQLCGRRERQKAVSGVEIIDVSGDAIMPDAREWMTKQLTEEQNINIQSHKKKDGPTTQQRKKHQITYLAFQAKEHELELKNQWANNRMSRKQTQAKYGF